MAGSELRAVAASAYHLGQTSLRETAMRDVVICEPVRTAVGGFGGSYRDVHAHVLGATVVAGLMERTKLPKDKVEDVIFAQCYSSMDAPALGRVVALDAGLPVEVTGMQIDRRCGSGLQAIWSGAQELLWGGVDVVLDMVGASYFDKNLQALNVGGRIVYIAALAGPVLEVPVMAIMQKRATITGSTLRPRSADEKARLASEIERVVWPWIAAGKLKPIVDATFPLEAAAQAHAHLEAGEHVGKVVLVA